MFLRKPHTKNGEKKKRIKKKGKGKDFLLAEGFLWSQSLALVNALIICYDFCPMSKSHLSIKSAFFTAVLETRFPLPKLRQT